METESCANCIYNNGSCQTLNNEIYSDNNIREDQFGCDEYEPIEKVDE